MRRMRRGLLYQAVRWLLIALLLVSCARHDELQVAAAASLQDALREIGSKYHGKITFVFGASNVLALQIRAGAPVDVFFSADEPTMNKIADRIAMRQDLLSNELVVVSREPLGDLLQVQRLALGDPNAVPAGVYARQYFQSHGLWEALRPKVIPVDNVRAALAAADNGSVDAAVVYRTDARMAKRAHIVMTLPGPLIRYPVAVLRDAKHPDAARRFVNELASPSAAAVFRKFGFVTLPPPRPASSRNADTISRPPARRRS
jgi:molybdate transport system substrate-binding protein